MKQAKKKPAPSKKKKTVKGKKKNDSRPLSFIYDMNIYTALISAVVVIVLLGLGIAFTLHINGKTISEIATRPDFFGTIFQRKQPVKPKPKPVIRVAEAPLPPTQAEMAQYIRQVFGKYADHALCIVSHESQMNPLAIHYENNGTIDRGLFQINSTHPYPADILFDWKQNVNIAFLISNQGTNWNAWTTDIYC